MLDLAQEGIWSGSRRTGSSCYSPWPLSVFTSLAMVTVGTGAGNTRATEVAASRAMTNQARQLVEAPVKSVPATGATGTVRRARQEPLHILRRKDTMLHTRTVTWALSLFTTVSYLLCVLYGLVTPRSIHMSQFLEIVLPGFRWLTPGGFLLGLAESFLWGAYVGLVFAPIYNGVHRRLRA